jgi:leucyl-tRNA synthetase
MKKILVTLMLLLTVFIPVASADIVNDLENKVNEYNQNAEYVPSYLKSLMGNEVIQLVIVTDDGEERYIKAITEDAHITTFEAVDENTEFDATMVVGANEATVRTILNSQNPLQEFIAAKDNGEIVIEPVGLVNTVKYTVANVVMKVSQLFGFM